MMCAFQQLQRGGEPATFANFLDSFKRFGRSANDNAILEITRECRETVFKLCRINKVAFDASIEHLIVIYHICGDGNPFQLLGCMVNWKLVMHHVTDAFVAQVWPKVAAILRTRFHYGSAALMSQCKTHIWGIIDDTTVFLEFKCALLTLRRTFFCEEQTNNTNQLRDKQSTRTKHTHTQRTTHTHPASGNIGMPDLLHNRMLDKAYPVFSKSLPFHCSRITIWTKHLAHVQLWLRIVLKFKEIALTTNADAENSNQRGGNRQGKQASHGGPGCRSSSVKRKSREAPGHDAGGKEQFTCRTEEEEPTTQRKLAEPGDATPKCITNQVSQVRTKNQRSERQREEPIKRTAKSRAEKVEREEMKEDEDHNQRDDLSRASSRSRTPEPQDLEPQHCEERALPTMSVGKGKVGVVLNVLY